MGFMQNLPCKLTEEEVHERRRVVLELMSKKDKADLELASVKSAHKAEVEHITERLADLRRAADTGQEMRMVECEEHTDFAAGKLITIRTDTGEILHSRSLTPEERQQNLIPLEGGKRKKKAVEQSEPPPEE